MAAIDAGSQVQPLSLAPSPTQPPGTPTLKAPTGSTLPGTQVSSPQAPSSAPSVQPVGSTLQAPSSYGTDVPAAPSPTTAPSSGLPTGYTLGNAGSNDWGSAYYNGDKVIGQSANGGIETANGIIPGSTGAQWQQLLDAENAQYLTPQRQAFSLNQAGQQSTDPAMQALLTDPNYQNAVINQQPDQNGNKLATSLYSGLNPQTQQEYQNSALYGDIYSQLQNAGINGPTPQAFPGSGQGPVNAQGQPIDVPGASPSGAPSSSLTTYNPMSIAGAQPSTASGAGGASGGAVGSQVASLLSGAGSSSAPASGSPSGPGYGLTPTDPNNPLTAQTITPQNTDFMGQVQQLIAANNAASQPQFEAELRDANRYAYGNGRGGSGIENTSLGDIVANRNLQQNQMAAQLGYNALGQQNENNYRNIGVEQQQQGFQNQQQQEAFQNALQQLLAGSSGDPSQIALVLSQIFGSQAGGIGNAASQYANSQTNANNSAIQNQQFQQFLQQLMNGYSGGTTPAQAPPNTFNPNPTIPNPYANSGYVPYGS